MARIVVVFALALAGAVGIASGPGAATRIRTETWRSGDESAPVRRALIRIDGRRLRMDVQRADSAPALSLVFHGDARRLWLLDPARQSYQTIDREQLTRARRQLDSARREAEARLATLSPEQRALVDKLLTGPAAPRRPAPALELERGDELRSIGGRPVRRFDLRRAGDRVGEIWVADFGALGVRRYDLRVFEDLAAFQRALLDVVAPGPSIRTMQVPFEVFDRLGGFPLLVRDIEGGLPTAETRFLEVEEGDVDPAALEVPAGWQSLPLRLMDESAAPP